MSLWRLESGHLGLLSVSFPIFVWSVLYIIIGSSAVLIILVPIVSWEESQSNRWQSCEGLLPEQDLINWLG